jgi:hypothetical protein
VTEVDSQRLGNGEDELAVRDVEQQLLVEVFGEQEGAFLRAGGAKIEALTAEGTEILVTAFRIHALDAGDAPGVIPAGFEPRHHAGDPFQAEPAVVLGVELVVVVGEGLEMVVEDVR